MTQILHIDSSPRGERSHSRQLTRAFVADLKASHPDATVVYHDLGHSPVPHVDETWIAAAYSDPATHTPELTQAVALSNQLIDELLASDILVVGAPMYNFSIPSTLKAYIDQIARPGRTFTVPDYQGLATGKKAFVFCARGGGYAPGQPMAGANFQDTYLSAILGLMGITDISYIYDEKTLSNESDLDNSLAKTHELAAGV